MADQTKQTSELIADLDRFYENGKNILMIGPHGTGKTTALHDFAKTRGIHVVYFSCSTMDPYTDFVGIPTPRRKCPVCPPAQAFWPVDNRDCPACGSALGDETLRNVRPLEVNEAEIIFLDEFSRADNAVTNACFELIQFGTINGEKLPNLKCVWAAMNPTDGGQYKVNDLDPALVDRFDIYAEVHPKPSFSYMVEQLKLNPHDVKAILQWWKSHDQEHRGTENYVSPRRLVKILQMYALTDDPFVAIPPGVTVDRNKLKGMLDKAKVLKEKKTVADSGGKLGEGAYTGFEYTADWIRSNQVPIASYLQDNPEDYDTCQEIIKAIAGKQGKTLGAEYTDALEYLRPAQLEAFLSSMGDDKRSAFVEALKNTQSLTGNAYESINRVLDEIDITGS